MRRGSVIGPLILIGLGILFLLRNLWPDIPLVDFISRFWPFLLIAWGAVRDLPYWNERWKYAVMQVPFGRDRDAAMKKEYIEEIAKFDPILDEPV